MPKYRIVGIHQADAYRNNDDLIGRIIEGPCVVGDNKEFNGTFDVLGECPECMEQPNDHYALHFIVEPHYEKTDWFSGDVKPVHVGEYEVERDFEYPKILKRLYLRWDGIQWRYTDHGTNGMRIVGQHANVYPNDKWRGWNKAD